MVHTRELDSTLDLLADPYHFISGHAQELDVDAFEARILLENTICMRGADAARLFYDETRFQRHDAAPELLQATLFGKHAVQTLDGERHRQRKAMLMSLLTPDHVQAMSELAVTHWAVESQRGEIGTRPLYEFSQRALTRAGCAWAGLLVSDAEAEALTEDLVLLFDSAARSLRSHVRSRRARRRLEEGLCQLIESERRSRNRPGKDTALRVISQYREDDEYLDTMIAATELLNLLRPIVAVSVYVVWMAHALESNPAYRERLKQDADFARPFIQEVRRYYPFFPAVVARTRKRFEWHGITFEKHQRVLLDLHGTNNDPRIWPQPDQFDPTRFDNGDPNEYEFIPQGGGDAATGHRCPGEGMTVGLMTTILPFLLEQLPSAAVHADLSLDEKRLPALPTRPIKI